MKIIIANLIIKEMSFQNPWKSPMKPTTVGIQVVKKRENS